MNNVTIIKSHKSAGARQKDRDERWSIEHSKGKVRKGADPRHVLSSAEGAAKPGDLAIPMLGCKRRISIDKAHGLICTWDASAANAHNDARLPVLIEHVLTRQKYRMGLVVRTIGLARATIKIGMASLGYNNPAPWLAQGRTATALRKNRSAAATTISKLSKKNSAASGQLRLYRPCRRHLAKIRQVFDMSNSSGLPAKPAKILLNIRADLAERKIEPVIPGRSNRRVKIEYDRALYKQRNRIERMFGHLKINRAIATRYDQLANSFLGMVHLATARYWFKFVHAA